MSDIEVVGIEPRDPSKFVTATPANSTVGLFATTLIEREALRELARTGEVDAAARRVLRRFSLLSEETLKPRMIEVDGKPFLAIEAPTVRLA
jgi:hypothetical protein